MAQFYFKVVQPQQANRFVTQWIQSQRTKKPVTMSWLPAQPLACMTVQSEEKQVMAYLWQPATQDAFIRHGLQPLYVSSPYIAVYAVKQPVKPSNDKA